MRTFKRTPNQVDTSLSSYSKSIKYFNQMEWKGIVENKNIYTVDQKSLSDAKNVYVDDQGTLKSRPVLIREPLSKDILPTNSRLVDMLTYGKVKIYISDDHYNSNHNYKITAIGTSTAVLNDITNYHISTVENYIVCFNDQGAKVFDINNQSKGWQDFSNFVEVPIIQRIVGGETSTYENNQFTTRYKKEYIWSNSSQPQLPSDYTASNGIDLVVNAQDGPFEWHLPVSSSRGTLDKTPLMQYMTFRKIKATVDISHIGSSGALEQGKFSAQGNTICISVEDGVLVSFDNGDTFTKEYLPYTQNHFEDWIAGITDDGAYYMRVHADGVHVLNLAKLQNKDDTRWEVIYPWNDSTKTIKGNFTTFNTNLRLKGYQYCAHFVTKDIFAFIVETNVGPVLWFMAPGLAGHSFIDYKKNSTSGNSGYKTPILTDDTIAANKVGTLSCSDLFQRGLGNSFCNQIDNKTSWSGSVESGLRGASLRIIKDHGELLENADKTGEHYQERTVESDYYTIAITMLANDTSSAEYGGPKNPTCFTCLILPGSQCVKYTDGTYEPLNADNRHWKDTFAMGAVFGPTLGTWGGGDEAHSDYAYSIVHDDFGSGKAVEYYPARKSDGSNHWLYTCTPKAIRVNSVQKIDKWTVGKYAGQGYNDMSSYMGSTKMGLWQVKGSVYLENLPDLIDTDTLDFTISSEEEIIAKLNSGELIYERKDV